MKNTRSVVLKGNGKGAGKILEKTIFLIGCSGHGKSTLQGVLRGENNEHVLKAEVSETVGGQSCTQEVQEYPGMELLEEGDTPTISLTVIDSMGFPDTNQEIAMHNYDKVVEAANAQPVDLFVWVCSNEKEYEHVFRRHKALMREFNHSEVPVVMLYNSFANLSADTVQTDLAVTNPAKFSQQLQHLLAKREGMRPKLAKDAWTLIQATEMVIDYLIVSTEKQELETYAKPHLHAFLTRQTTSGPKKSNLKTLEQKKKEWSAAKTTEQKEQLVLKETEAFRKKMRISNSAAQVVNRGVEFGGKAVQLAGGGVAAVAVPIGTVCGLIGGLIVGAIAGAPAAGVGAAPGAAAGQGIGGLIGMGCGALASIAGGLGAAAGKIGVLAAECDREHGLAAWIKEEKDNSEREAQEAKKTLEDIKKVKTLLERSYNETALELNPNVKGLK